MQTQGTDDESLVKLCAFVDYVERHFVETAAADRIAESCTATCLLLFSAADAFGAVFHPATTPRRNYKRFEWTVSQLGENYAVHATKLWRLRNALVHEARADDTYLSHVKGVHHLDVTSEGRIVVNTREMVSDFRALISRIRAGIEERSQVSIEADSRLEWASETIQEKSDTTPPPDHVIRFPKVIEESEMTEQENKLTAAGWTCQWRKRIEKSIGHQDSRTYSAWAMKGNLEVAVTGNISQEKDVWENVYLEAKRLDPSGL